MAQGLIDVWHAGTFDEDLKATLTREADLVFGYFTSDRRIFLEYDYKPGPNRPFLRPDNPHTAAFAAFREMIELLMRTRVIRAWHYTRLTNSEVDRLRHEGVHLSTPETLRSRLDSLVLSGALAAHLADTLYAASPFHGDQHDARLNKFWMASHPVAVDDGGVRPLISRWGGEVASFWMGDETKLAALAGIGKSRVIELAVPLELTRQSYWAAAAVLATFGRSLGCATNKHDFDLYVTAPLRSDAILAVHTEGDASFHGIGQSYPEGYVDVHIGYWKELTGEDG